MDRIAFAFQVAPEHEADFLATSEAFQDVFDDFAASRRDLGLTRMEVYAHPSTQGRMVVFVLEGQLESYFAHIRSASGVDEWMREKIIEWVGSESEVQRLYQCPQSEQLFAWLSEA